MHIAVRCGYEPDIKPLLDYGADINMLDGGSRTPLLHVAVCLKYFGAQDIVRLLLASGVRIDIEDHQGYIAHDIAQRMGTKLFP